MTILMVNKFQFFFKKEINLIIEKKLINFKKKFISHFSLVKGNFFSLIKNKNCDKINS